MPKRNLVRKDTFHYKWSRDHKPVLHVKPGDRVHFEVNEVSSWQITKNSVTSDLAKIDDKKLYPLAGPVYIEGAAPGDALVVKIEKVKIADWGWTAIIPGLGLLEEFKDPELNIWNLKNKKYATFRKGMKITLNPFCGVMGVAPAQEGYFDAMPPGKHGGNMDVKHLVDGAKLILPVWTEGALFSACDIHAAQGDGEVCVTAIECPGEATVSFDLVKHANISYPQYFTTEKASTVGNFVTTGISPDLMEASKIAVRGMIDQLGKKGLSRNEAYMLCSVAGNLMIHEVVDAPNWVVGLALPRTIFDKSRKK
ncbi:MAG: acetamidase/formamidase family protein [Nitrososphaerales archaeon]